MAIVRNVAAVLGGVIAAGVVIALVETVGHSVLEGGSVIGAAAVGYGLGALVGTVVATMIAGRQAAVAVPFILAVLAAFNFVSFPHPRWFAPAAVAALALGWWIGSVSGSRKSTREPTAREGL